MLLAPTSESNEQSEAARTPEQPASRKPSLGTPPKGMHAAARASRMVPSSRASKRDKIRPGLHRSLGNRAVLRIQGNTSTPLLLQRKLRVGAVNDPLETEADSVANMVMRMPEPNLNTSRGSRGTFQRKCADCEEETDAEIHGTALRTIARNASGNVSNVGGPIAPPLVGEVARSSGRPLDTSVRNFFEPRFKRDLGDVRVHTDSTAAMAARSVNALAYTVGSDITFADGQYQPATTAGRTFLAHELAHVMQQSSSDPFVQRQSDCSDPDFCTPYATPAESAAAKANLRAGLLPKVGLLFGSEVRQLWTSFLNRHAGDSLARTVFQNAGDPVVESFKTSSAIDDDQDAVMDIVASRLGGVLLSDNVPAMYPLSAFLSSAEKVRDIDFSNPFTIEGNIAGGVGSSDAGPDLRQIQWGNVNLERTPLIGGIGYTSIELTLHYEVLDAVDFCPGGCGSFAEQHYTIPLSRLEASGEAYDVPFAVRFVPPSKSRRVFFS